MRFSDGYILDYNNTFFRNTIFYQYFRFRTSLLSGIIPIRSALWLGKGLGIDLVLNNLSNQEMEIQHVIKDVEEALSLSVIRALVFVMN